MQYIQGTFNRECYQIFLPPPHYALCVYAYNHNINNDNLHTIAVEREREREWEEKRKNEMRMKKKNCKQKGVNMKVVDRDTEGG
jgi:hypothetical protein